MKILFIAAIFSLVFFEYTNTRVDSLKITKNTNSCKVYAKV